MIGHERGLYRVNLSCEIKIYLGSTTRCSVKCAPHVKQSLGVSVDLEEEEAILRRQVDLDHEKLNRTTKSGQRSMRQLDFAARTLHGSHIDQQDDPVV